MFIYFLAIIGGIVLVSLIIGIILFIWYVHKNIG